MTFPLGSPARRQAPPRAPPTPGTVVVQDGAAGCGAAVAAGALAPPGAADRRRGAVAAVRCWRWSRTTRDPALLHLGRRRAAAQQGRRARRLVLRPGALPVRLLGLVAGAGGAACLAVGLARAVRRDDEPAVAEPALPRVVFWVGLVLLLAASCALEWTRLYQWETRLPGHAGGVLGFTLGPLSMHWLGFAGSGVLWIAALVAGMSLALRFSWLALAERIGARSTRCASAASSAWSGPRTAASARGAARARARGRGRAPGGRGPPADRDRAAGGRSAQVRARGQGAAEAAVRRTGRHQAAAGRPARRGRRRAWRR